MNTLRLIGLFILATTTFVRAQVPLSQEPRHHATFENPQLRILNINIPPGDTTLDHRHDFDIATVAMTSGTNTRQQPGGQPWSAPRPPRMLGDVSVTEYAGKAQSHRVENLGTTAYQLFAVENLKKSGWSTAPAASGLGTKLTNDSRAFRIYDVRLVPRETSQTAHTHAVPTIAVLITGTVMSDGPDKQAKANAPAPVGLKQLTEPGQWILVPAGDTHHMVRLGTGEARVVEIEVR
jgi:quercetin dioxygenase-like cupin family protein